MLSNLINKRKCSDDSNVFWSIMVLFLIIYLFLLFGGFDSRPLLNEKDTMTIFGKDMNELSYYCVTIFRLLGKNLMFIRMSFTFIGLLGFLGYIFLLKEFFPDKKRNQFIAIILYMLSTPIFLHNDTICYGVSALTFTTLSILFFFRSMHENKKRDWILMGVSMIMLYNSLCLFFFIVIINLSLTYLIFYSNNVRKKRMRIFLFVCIVFCMKCLFFSLENADLSFIYELLLGYVWMIQAYVFPYLVLIPLFYWLRIIDSVKSKKIHENNPDGIYKEYFRKNKKSAEVSSPWFCCFLQIAINLIVICAFCTCLNIRLLFASIPFFYIIITKIIDYFFSKSMYVALVILGVISLTNIMHVTPYFFVKSIYDEHLNIQCIVKPPVLYCNMEETQKTKQYDLAYYLDTFYFRSYILDFGREIFMDIDEYEIKLWDNDN